MNKTPLYDLHIELGADFEEFSGWLMPSNYGDEKVEYQAVRRSVGIIDLSHRGKLRLSGKEHLRFLQGMLTNDIGKAEEGEGLYSTILTNKGRVVADMNVYRKSQSVLLDMEPRLNQKVSELLTKFRLSYKASIEDITEELALLSVQGPESKELLNKILQEELPGLIEYHFIRREVNGSDVMISNVSRTGEVGYDLFVDTAVVESLWNSLLEAGEGLGAKPVGQRVLETLRIEAGIPRYGVDMDENTIPIEAGLWHALSFDKGCYIGQEVVARIKYRGRVNWHLMGFEIEGKDVPGKDDKIVSGEKNIGRITCGAYSPARERPIALGYIRREYKEPGTEVTLNMGENSETARVVETPFSLK